MKQQKNSKRGAKAPQKKKIAQRPRADIKVTASGPSRYTLTQRSQQIVQVRGHETLGLASASDADGKVRLAACFDLNPACWRNSRLSGIARAYERYRYNSFTVHYIPRAAKTTTGVVAVSCEFDGTDDLRAGEDGLVVASQHAVFAQGPVHSSCSASWRRPAEDKGWYNASYEDSFDNVLSTSQGRIYALVASSIAGTQGTIVLEYDVDFYMPELECGITGNQYLSGSITDAVSRTGNIKFAVTPTGVNPDNVGIIRFVPQKVLINGTEVDSYLAQKGVISGANTTAIQAGKEIALAWDGANSVWNLFEDLLQAANLSEPLCVRNAQPAAQLSVLGFGKEMNI